jgi:magnesium transporter
MMDAFASIISNNVNAVMKFLAAATIVIALPTLVASIFGMNVPLPFQDSGWSTVLILFLAMGLSAIVTRVFVKRGWF